MNPVRRPQREGSGPGRDWLVGSDYFVIYIFFVFYILMGFMPMCFCPTPTPSLTRA